MKFVQGEAAIKSGNYIVISDVHIGFEEKLEEKGYTIPEQTQNVTDRLKELRKIAENLIILGDLKHSINIRKKNNLLLFLSEISELFKEIIIIKGNHDGRIEDYTKNFRNIKVMTEFLKNKILFIHGNKYASNESIRKAETIMLGHFHSAHAIKDNIGIVRNWKSWAIYDFDNESYDKDKKVKTQIKKVLGFPCFNAFFDGSGEKNGPYAKYLDKKEVFTLDLIKLV